jgi:hypothetical protein
MVNHLKTAERNELRAFKVIYDTGPCLSVSAPTDARRSDRNRQTAHRTRPDWKWAGSVEPEAAAEVLLTVNPTPADPVFIASITSRSVSHLSEIIWTKHAVVSHGFRACRRSRPVKEAILAMFETADQENFGWAAVPGTVITAQAP